MNPMTKYSPLPGEKPMAVGILPRFFIKISSFMLVSNKHNEASSPIVAIIGYMGCIEKYTFLLNKLSYMLVLPV